MTGFEHVGLGLFMWFIGACVGSTSMRGAGFTLIVLSMLSGP